MIRRLVGFQALLLMVLLPSCTNGSQGQAESAGGPGEPVVYTADGVTLTMHLYTDSIHVILSAPTTGWVSVGFEPSQVMKDADIYIGYVENGTVLLRDDFGTGNTSHAPDTSLGGASSYTGLSGTESGGVTEISFMIARNPGDPYDKVLTAGGTYKVLVGYGPDDADDFTTYHSWVKSVDLTL